MLALAEFYCVGVMEPERSFVGGRVGYKSLETKAVRVCFSKTGPLAMDGLVELPSKSTIAITLKGLAATGHKEGNASAGIMTNDDLFDLLCSVLFDTPPESKVLRALADGRAHSVQELLSATGYKREDTKAFRNPINKLKKSEYLEQFKSDEGVKMYRLTDKAFPAGRP